MHKLGAPVDAGRGNEIDHANRVAATEQQSNKVRTDETGAARDKTSLRCRAIGLFSYCFLCTLSSDGWMAEAGPPNLAGTPGGCGKTLHSSFESLRTNGATATMEYAEVFRSKDGTVSRPCRDEVMLAEAGIQTFRISWIPA